LVVLYEDHQTSLEEQQTLPTVTSLLRSSQKFLLIVLEEKSPDDGLKKTERVA
jgi:hypothetical protein